MRSSKIPQLDPVAEDQGSVAGPSTTLAEAEIRELLDGIRWGPGDQLTATRLAQALGVSVGRIHRSALSGNAIRSAEGTRGRIKLVMVKRFGEHWVSRRALEIYLRGLNGLDGPDAMASSVPVRRSAAQRRRDSEQAARMCEALGA